MHFYTPATGLSDGFKTTQPITALAPCQDGTSFVAATTSGFGLLEWDTRTLESLGEVAREGTRMNDGKCDPLGRFLAGSMAHNLEDSQGELFALERDLTIRPVLTNVTISNGLDWSSDGATMFYVDSATCGIDAFDYDVEAGVLRRRRKLVSVRRREGLLDGLAADADDFIWVAVAYSGQVRRYSPTGELADVIEVPAPVVTSCCFGGEDLSTLFITTAAEYVPVTGAAVADQGALFAVQVPTPGLPTRTFRQAA